MADWRRYLGVVLLWATLLVGCSSDGAESADRQPAETEETDSAAQTADSVSPDTAQDAETTAATDPAAPTTVVTEEQVAEAQSGYDPGDASIGKAIDVVDPAGVINRAEAFIPDQFPEDRGVIDQMIEGETGVTYGFLGYDAVLLYEPLPHCGKLPSLQADQQDGELLLSVVLDKSGDCSDLAFTAAVGIDFNDGFVDLPIVATHR